jgi:hypothetical protein
MGDLNVLGLSVMAVFWLGCGDAGAIAVTEAGTGDAGLVVSIQGHVHAPDGTGLAGADVCALGATPSGASPCATSDPEGSFTLSALPANELVSLTFHRDGFVPMLRDVLTDDKDLRLPESENTLLAATQPASFLGVAADPTKGQIAFLVENTDGNAPPVDVTLTGFDGTPTPTALSSDGKPSGGVAAGSTGGFANVAPGPYILRVGGASATCLASDLYGLPITAYQPSSVASLAVSVVAGYVTAPVVISCARIAP